MYVNVGLSPSSQLNDISGGLRRALAKRDVELLKVKLGELDQLRDDLRYVFSVEWLVQYLERAVSSGFPQAVTLFLPYIRNPDNPQIRHALQIQANIASQQGHYDIALALCRYHPVCLQQAPSGDSPIIPAAKNERGYDLLTYLVENGICVNLQNSTGTTALHNAVRSQCVKNIEFLLENRACVNLPDSSGTTPKDIVSCTSLDDTLSEAAEYDDHPSLEEASLYLAARTGDPVLVQNAIDTGLSVNTQWVGGKTALHGAIESTSGKSVVLVKCLLENGAKILPTASDPLLFVVNFALHRSHYRSAHLLLECTIAELQEQSEKESLPWDTLCKSFSHTLFLTARFGFLELADHLIQLCDIVPGLSFSCYVYKDQLKPIHVAAKHGKTSFLTAIINQGESPTSKDHHGNTPLHYCAYYGYIDTAKYLLGFETVDINSTNNFGCTPLYTVLHKKIYSDEVEQCLEKSVIFLVLKGAKLVAPGGQVCELREQKIDAEFNERWSFVSPHTRKLILSLREYDPPLKLAEICRLRVRSLITNPSDGAFLSLPLPPVIMSFLRCD